MGSWWICRYCHTCASLFRVCVTLRITHNYQVLLSSDMLPSQATEHLLEPDNIELLLIPYRSRTSISLSTDLDLTLVSQEHVGDIGIARYRWLVPTCIRPGRHEVRPCACMRLAGHLLCTEASITDTDIGSIPASHRSGLRRGF